MLTKKDLLTKKVSFKMMHPVKMYLTRNILDLDSVCVFCGRCHKALIHLFCDLIYTKTFWTDMVTLFYCFVISEPDSFYPTYFLCTQMFYSASMISGKEPKNRLISEPPIIHPLIPLTA